MRVVLCHVRETLTFRGKGRNTKVTKNHEILLFFVVFVGFRALRVPFFLLQNQATGAVHCNTSAAQVRPAPKATIPSRLPGVMRPSSMASHSAMGMAAAEVLP